MTRYAALLLLLLTACGTDPCNGGTYLAGDHTQEELTALTDVLRAFRDAGYAEPDAAVIFVRSPDMRFKGTTWGAWRAGDYPANNEGEGYRGYWDESACAVYVRRYGDAEPYLYQLLVHELAHAAGYIHGSRMRAFEATIWDEM